MRHFRSRQDLEARQLASVRSLLDELLSSNPFYSKKLRAAGIGAGLANLGEFVKRTPFTTKQELVEDQIHHPPYGSNLTYPVERYTRYNQTSATTAEPLRWLDTPESWNWMLENWARVYEAAGVKQGERIFFAFSFGPFLGFWTAFESAVRLGCLCLPGGGMRSDLRLRTLIANGATVLCCTPTYAIRLAEVAAEEKIDLAAAKVKSIIVAGETGGSIPATRAHIERLWPGARVVDHHGMTEVGPVSYGCPRRDNVLHVIESAYITEVIDIDTARPVRPGERGELALTTLGRTGSPLLRYRTGDVVEPEEKSRCECGSFDLALNGGILGRTDDMVIVRGVNIYPGAVEHVLRACGGVAEYRVEIRTDRALPELTVQVEPSPEQEDGGGLAVRLEAALSNAFSLRIPVAIVPRGTLPRFEMKAKRWVKLPASAKNM